MKRSSSIATKVDRIEPAQNVGALKVIACAAFIVFIMQSSPADFETAAIEANSKDGYHFS
jgi:hypothetical protein